MFRSLRYRNFRLFFIGQFVSLCGSWMQQTAQSWLVYRLTKDALMLGLIAFAGQFPVFVVGWLAGTKIDQTRHLELVKLTQFLAMVQAALLAALAYSGRVAVWHVFVLALLLGVVNAFDMPARQVLIGELVDAEHRHNAIALNSTIVNGSRIFGPALAGFAIGWIGEGGCFALNALSFLAVLLALFRMEDVRQAPPREQRSLWRDVGDGVSYALGHQPIRLVLFVLTVFSVCGLPVYVLMPIIADGVLKSGAKGLGVLSSFSGLGATVGALLLARRASSRGLSGVIPQCSLIFGLSLLGLAYCRSFWLAAALLWVVGWAAIQVIAAANTLLQELSSDEFRGRIMSFYAMIFIGLSPVGSFLVGGLTSRFGVARTLLAEGAACVLLGAAQWAKLPGALSRHGRGADWAFRPISE
jgi:MFS family permease